MCEEKLLRKAQSKRIVPDIIRCQLKYILEIFEGENRVINFQSAIIQDENEPLVIWSRSGND